jgi:N-acetylglutamate synthase-like GNAT family acetyltransferase
MAVNIVQREITDKELERMNAGFEEHALEFGVINNPEIRHSYVVLDSGTFVGCISGLQYHSWFYITDLWLEKPYRKKGLGAELIQKIESKIVLNGVKNVYTWTAGYEAAPFYVKQGYTVFCELEDYYSTGHSRIGLRKAL